jgi:hypothetical protein
MNDENNWQTNCRFIFAKLVSLLTYEINNMLLRIDKTIKASASVIANGSSGIYRPHHPAKLINQQ